MKYKTEQERKEASLESKRKWYRNNKDYHKTFQARQITHFVVYKHTSSKGRKYIGCGHNLRPYQFSKHNRSKTWHKAFDNDCKVTIIAEFKDKESALKLEDKLIRETGINKLVNQRHVQFS